MSPNLQRSSSDLANGPPVTNTEKLPDTGPNAGDTALTATLSSYTKSVELTDTSSSVKYPLFDTFTTTVLEYKAGGDKQITVELLK